MIDYSICDDCILNGRCSGHCSDTPNYNEDEEKENDRLDSDTINSEEGE